MSFAFLFAGLCIVSAAQGQSAGSAEPAKEGAPGQSATELAKQLANPVSSIWSISNQINNFQLTNDRWNYNWQLQPVMPVSLTSDLNLITRPVIQIYNSVPYQTPSGADARTTNFGDWVQLELVSPAHSGPWLLGLGPTFIFPTAGSIYTGQGKWQAGPAFIVAYLSKTSMLGVFPQLWWSIGGDSTRPNTSQMNLQPIASLFLEDGWSVGYSGNIIANWKASSGNVWTVPLGMGVSKVVKFGRLPVKLGLAWQYMVVQPDGGQRWNIQFQITPVIPKLIKETLF